MPLANLVAIFVYFLFSLSLFMFINSSSIVCPYCVIIHLSAFIRPLISHLLVISSISDTFINYQLIARALIRVRPEFTRTAPLTFSTRFPIDSCRLPLGSRR